MKIYKQTVDYEPMVEVGEKEVEFLNDFIIDYHTTYYYVDGEILDEALLDCKEPPAELVKFLREQIKDDGFEFVVE